MNMYMFKSARHICGKQILGESKNTARAFNLNPKYQVVIWVIQ